MSQVEGKTESRVYEGVVSLPYRWALGPVNTRFFDELKQKKIMGTRCPSCERVLVPARKFCPRCFQELEEWVQVSDTGVVETWALINIRFSGQAIEPPYVSASIRLDGSDVGFVHQIGGVEVNDLEKTRERVKIGTRVKARWRDECQGDIFDIQYFEPVE
ncbi:MAG: Zn-ribbon domain-containing OB-fold protein [Firmicutes bacterium]|nr:Zn-ribbon domain-containing OB-fold protein [Bacillota bacterium]